MTAKKNTLHTTLESFRLRTTFLPGFFQANPVPVSDGIDISLRKGGRTLLNGVLTAAQQSRDKADCFAGG